MWIEKGEVKVINDLIKKLRKAADVLDELMDSFPTENRKAVRSIRKNMDLSLNMQKGQKSKAEWKAANLVVGKSKQMLNYAEDNDHPVIILKKKGSSKGFKYNGKHWTQKPENKARLRKMLKKSKKIQDSQR